MLEELKTNNKWESEYKSRIDYFDTRYITSNKLAKKDLLHIYEDEAYTSAHSAYLFNKVTYI